MTEGVRTSLNPENAAAKPLPALDDLPDGGLLEVEAEIDGVPESLILHRKGDSVHAWLNICPHAGRRLDWAPGKFLMSKDGLLVCAAHGASFELSGGACIAGPCRGDSLRAVAMEVVEGRVVVRNPEQRPV
jgi:nitrite reductase/ring-hydroxylating ferredoxin subunit